MGWSTNANHLKYWHHLQLPNNRGQLKNSDISSALYTLRIHYQYTQTQCEDGTRDVRVLELIAVSYKQIEASEVQIQRRSKNGECQQILVVTSKLKGHKA